MLKFFYNPKYKYTNRTIINIDGDTNYVEKDYANIDSSDTINGHIIYSLSTGENIPTYILDTDNNRRYFVSGITQLRTGKFQISLLRDIISENPLLWKNESAYINAGLATNFNKYKRWNLPFTNTKVKQERLDINGKSSYFVFYVNKQEYANNTITEEDLEVKATSTPNITNVDYEVANLNELLGYEYVGAGNFDYWEIPSATLFAKMDTGNGVFGGSNLKLYNVNYINDSINIGNPTSVVNNNIFLKTFAYKVQENTNNCLTDLKNAIKNFILGYQDTLGQTISETNYNNLENYVNKYILDTTNLKVYTIKKELLFDGKVVQEISKNDSGTLTSALRNINFPPIYNTQEENLNITGNSYITLTSYKKTVSYKLVELSSATTFNFNFIANTRKLPKSAVRCVNIVANEDIADNDIAQMLMLAQTNGINEDNTTGRILDIQYLPFSIATKTDENIKINNKPMIAQFLDNDDIFFTTNLPNLENINKETDTIKIVSPSRASQFLFRPYDNDGIMKFDFKATLRPFNSVMYVRPSTQGLLLYDWDDKDCLIISEDFSLTNVTNEWTQYVYSNRNYQNTFNREIQGREFERDWERKIEDANRRADDWSSRNISSQKAQTYTGNLPIISNVAGAIGSAFQDQTYMQMAQLDREYNEAMYQESIKLSKDMFSYQLDNIKSQPAIPSKITSFDAKSLDGIYLEYYSTNVTEKSAIESFYKYNGHRIDDFGTFANYYGPFVRGKIIISKNYTQPEVKELNNRLLAGIFTEEL